MGKIDPGLPFKINTSCKYTTLSRDSFPPWGLWINLGSGGGGQRPPNGIFQPHSDHHQLVNSRSPTLSDGSMVKPSQDSLIGWVIHSLSRYSREPTLCPAPRRCWKLRGEQIRQGPCFPEALRASGGGENTLTTTVPASISGAPTRCQAVF